MRGLKNILPKSIFFRLILMFMLFILPIFLLSVSVHQWGVAIIRDEIVNSMKSQMEYHKSLLDNEFERIQYLQYNCLEDQDLLELSNFTNGVFDFNKVQSMNRLQNRLTTIKNSSIYIEDVKAMIYLQKKSISANDGVEDISAQDMTARGSLGGKISKMTIQNQKLTSIVRNISLNNMREKPHALLQIQFSNQVLKNSFMNFNVYQGSGTFLYNPGQNYIISTENGKEVTNQLVKVIDRYSNKTGIFTENIKCGDQNYLVILTNVEFGDSWLATYIPTEKIYSPLNKYLYLLWIITIITVLIIGVFSYFTHKLLQRPLRKLVKAFKRVEDGELKFSIEHTKDDEFRYLYKRFNAMLEYINNLIEQVYSQKIMSQKAELKQLQSQINPHFLFNSFFILQRMIQSEDNVNAERYCRFLGQYFQYVTRNSKDEMPFYKELEHARNYLEIQAIRFSNIEIAFEEVPGRYKDLLVPRLILQPIIENVFEHGFGKRAGDRKIVIRFEEAHHSLSTIIEDNGTINNDELETLKKNLIADQSDIESTALININKRIKLRFGPDSGVSVSPSVLGGLQVVMRFDIQEGQNV